MPIKITTFLTALYLLISNASVAIEPIVAIDDHAGPYDVRILAGSIGFSRPLSANSRVTGAMSAWTISAWLRVEAQSQGVVTIATVGDCIAGNPWRGFLVDNGELQFRVSPTDILHSRRQLEPNQWVFALATYDGSTVRLFVDGQERNSLALRTQEVEPVLNVAPVEYQGTTRTVQHFGGSLAHLLIENEPLNSAQVMARVKHPPDFALITFTTPGVGWPWQEHAWRGLQAPQDAWTRPKSRAALPKPVAAPVVESSALASVDENLWRIGAWRLRSAAEIAATGEDISKPAFDATLWYPAIVPGTVLTTLIARGVYPDSDYGLNNMAIPESLNTHAYWYRTTFAGPARAEDQKFSITLKGINYSADVWLNGHQLGSMHGAFMRGVFDVTRELLPGRTNVLAVRVSPSPHPGIPHEQSIRAGPGNNGGAMAIDGPTFFASEGWDWIPGIRDRNTGIWQEVILSRSGTLTLGDPHVMTHLPLPRTDQAEVRVTIPVTNSGNAPLEATVQASFDDVVVRKRVQVTPGTTLVLLTPEEIPALRISHPTLWWPNGYGEPALHTLRIEVREGGAVSDSTSLRFGIRELTYELSLFDGAGRLRRVEIDPTLAALSGERLVDIRHEAIKRTANGWAESLSTAAEHSAAVRPVYTESLSPFLVLRVNGVPIAARGGNWGMDDSRKRTSREHLEPYFKLTRDANLNIIRNWAGQNTEEVFYDLADEYGLLVLNDFWASTQDFQMEPQDPQLFLANARDVISRYRNHPSIAVWFGRNEGVPQPIINEGLDDLIASLDGTRYYTGSSNSINLQGSGPYDYRPPEGYFTDLASGFSVEVGSPSLSTLESLRASIAPRDLWPLSDAYAYHDWHFGGNGDTGSFMAELADEFGEARGLEDFERKAQMLDYVSYRAIFEGFQAHLWTKNSGRLLWMSHPAWPSNTWQIYSSDYDTAAAYYAVKKACEPLHAQLNLPDFTLAVTNITRTARPRLQLRTRVTSLDNTLIDERIDHLDTPANSVTILPEALKLRAILEREEAVIVQLELRDPQGRVVSTNSYWEGRNSASLRRLNTLRPQPIGLRISTTRVNSGQHVKVDVRNEGSQPVFNVKLTALNASRARVLPVSYSDNYLTLLRGETRTVTIDCPQDSGSCTRIAVRGWNVQSREVNIGQTGYIVR